MIIWRGFGFLVFATIFPGALVSMLIHGEYRVGTTFFASAVICFLTGLLIKYFRRKRSEINHKDTLFWLGFTPWSIIFLVLGFWESL
jgi:hypothetical protein